jgi:ABC-type antimicrobial peptide transport system permease subunit
MGAARPLAIGVAGTAVGLWLAPGVWRVIESAIPGLPVWSPGLVVPLAALLVTIAGAVLPAWHAAQMTPAALLAFETD